MKRLGDELTRFASSLSSSDGFRYARRAARVQEMWKDAVEYVYKKHAPLVLEHVNAVYLKDDGGLRTLIVYLDDADFRADVHCRQELLLFRIRDHFGEEVDAFKTLPARFDMRARHPYVSRETSESAARRGGAPEAEGGPSSAAAPVPLTPDELARSQAEADAIEDPALRRALLKAMVADKEWKKGQPGQK